jgi:hypothetical protein
VVAGFKPCRLTFELLPRSNKIEYIVQRYKVRAQVTGGHGVNSTQHSAVSIQPKEQYRQATTAAEPNRSTLRQKEGEATLRAAYWARFGMAMRLRRGMAGL